jgi:hypothetical protein
LEEDPPRLIGRQCSGGAVTGGQIVLGAEDGRRLAGAPRRVAPDPAPDRPKATPHLGPPPLPASRPPRGGGSHRPLSWIWWVRHTCDQPGEAEGSDLRLPAVLLSDGGSSGVRPWTRQRPITIQLSRNTLTGATGRPKPSPCLESTIRRSLSVRKSKIDLRGWMGSHRAAPRFDALNAERRDLVHGRFRLDLPRGSRHPTPGQRLSPRGARDLLQGSASRPREREIRPSGQEARPLGPERLSVGREGWNAGRGCCDEGRVSGTAGRMRCEAGRTASTGFIDN